MSRISALFILAVLLILGINSANAQITLQCVKPGQELLVKPDNDTLWVMNDSRMRSVIETGRLSRIQKEQLEVLSAKCDTLTAISQQKDSLINILKDDKAYYEAELKTSREDVVKAGELARKYKRRARLATWGIAVGAGLGLAVGYFLFND